MFVNVNNYHYSFAYEKIYWSNKHKFLTFFRNGFILLHVLICLLMFSLNVLSPILFAEQIRPI